MLKDIVIMLNEQIKKNENNMLTKRAIVECSLYVLDFEIYKNIWIPIVSWDFDKNVNVHSKKYFKKSPTLQNCLLNHENADVTFSICFVLCMAWI